MLAFAYRRYDDPITVVLTVSLLQAMSVNHGDDVVVVFDGLLSTKLTLISRRSVFRLSSMSFTHQLADALVGPRTELVFCVNKPLQRPSNGRRVGGAC